MQDAAGSILRLTGRSSTQAESEAATIGASRQLKSIGFTRRSKCHSGKIHVQASRAFVAMGVKARSMPTSIPRASQTLAAGCRCALFSAMASSTTTRQMLKLVWWLWLGLALRQRRQRLLWSTEDLLVILRRCKLWSQILCCLVGRSKRNACAGEHVRVLSGRQKGGISAVRLVRHRVNHASPQAKETEGTFAALGL